MDTKLTFFTTLLKKVWLSSTVALPVLLFEWGLVSVVCLFDGSGLCCHRALPKREF